MASITPLFIYFAAPLTLDLCCCSGATFPTSSVAHVSEAKVTSRPNVHIPDITLEDLREAGRPEDIEEWEQRVTSLFEWIGLAGLGSQRCVHVPCIWFLSSQLDRCTGYLPTTGAIHTYLSTSRRSHHIPVI